MIPLSLVPYAIVLLIVVLLVAWYVLVVRVFDEPLPQTWDDLDADWHAEQRNQQGHAAARERARLDLVTRLGGKS